LALLLQAAERGGFFLAAADEPGLLKLQVTELLFVNEMSVQLDEAAADAGMLLVFEQAGELDATFGVDGHFERGNAAQAPGDIGEGLDQLALFEAGGLQFVFVGGDVALVFGGVVTGEQDGGAGEPGFDGIQGRIALAFFGARASAEKGIRAIALGGAADGACGHGRLVSKK
jgi:hypothetical protein